MTHALLYALNDLGVAVATGALYGGILFVLDRRYGIRIRVERRSRR